MPAAPAGALCIYRGVADARTSDRQEYADARWVVRARVLGAASGVVEAGKPDAGMAWTAYRLEVIRAYKGKPPRQIRIFTKRSSGGFFMDRPWVPLPRGHDVGGEYLLFLNPIAPRRGQPRAERGAAFVNYNCGRSRAWREVSPASRRLLEALSAGR